MNYWAAFLRFAGEEQRLNRIASEGFASALFVCAVLLFFPRTSQSFVLAVAATIAIVAYALSARLVLAIHADVYIVLAAAPSSLPVYVSNAFAGAIPAVPDRCFYIVGFSALICFLGGSRHLAMRGARRLFIALPIFLVSAAVASLAMVGVVHLAASYFELDASRKAALPN